MLKYSWISEHVDEKSVVKLCSDMVKIPSTTGEEREIAEFISNKMKDLGFQVDLYEADKNRPNVVGVISSGKKGPRIILNGHMDTVPPGDFDKWSLDPYSGEVRGRRLYGRGSCDMKGGISSLLNAVETILGEGIELRGDLVLCMVVDEERGGYKGTEHIMNKGIRGDHAIIAEPSKMNVLIANKGDLGMNLKVYGKTAHAANPQMGINAIHNLIKIVNRILEIPDKFNWSARTHPLVGPPTIGISVIKGGIQRNMVPDYCSAVVDRRIVPGLETIDEAKTEIEQEVKEAMVVDPLIKAELETFIRVEACEIGENEKIVQTLLSSYREYFGLDPLVTGVSYFTDAHFMVNRYGIPTAIFGPGSIDQAHAVDEYVDVDQLVNASRVYALTLSELLG
jgi:acetylornithine deacetylase/succinyl-diaminopimelate desuccinylase family protein